MPDVAPDSNSFLAHWTAKGNNLCLGYWEISYPGSLLQLKPEIKQNDMGTYAIYCFFDPDNEMFAEASRFAAGRQWHPRQIARTRSAVCRFPDPTRHQQSAGDPGLGHRLARAYVVPGDW